MDSLVLQCLTIVAIAVLVYEARRWAGSGVSIVRSSLDRAARVPGATLRPLEVRGSRPTIPARTTVETARPPMPRQVLSDGLGTAAAGFRPVTAPMPAAPRRGGNAGWLALIAIGAATAIVAAMLVRSEPE